MARDEKKGRPNDDLEAEALAALDHARAINLVSCPEMNDDKSALTTLLTCVGCAKSMRLERIDPEGDGRAIIQFRCEQCGGTDRLRLIRRIWPSP